MSKHVMLVDDNPFALEMMARELQQLGLDTTCSLDGIDALARLQWDDYSLIVCDLGLPPLSGLPFIQRVLEKYPDIAVIALSTDDTLTEEKARQHGLLVLRKPFSMVDFRLAVGKSSDATRAGPKGDFVRSAFGHEVQQEPQRESRPSVPLSEGECNANPKC